MKKDPSKKPGDKPVGKQSEPFESLAEVQLPAPAPKPIQVRRLEAPPRFERRDNIHPRRVLPRVREGKEREFHSTTDPVLLHPPLAMSAIVRAATDDLTLVVNTELTGPGQQQLASNVGEPSTAAKDQEVLYTATCYTPTPPDV